jgi:hypothetical protein
VRRAGRRAEARRRDHRHQPPSAECVPTSHSQCVPPFLETVPVIGASSLARCRHCAEGRSRMPSDETTTLAPAFCFLFFVFSWRFINRSISTKRAKMVLSSWFLVLGSQVVKSQGVREFGSLGVQELDRGYQRWSCVCARVGLQRCKGAKRR